MPADYLYLYIYTDPQFGILSRKKYFGVSCGGSLSGPILEISEAPAVLFCGGIEGEYAMGKGLESR